MALNDGPWKYSDGGWRDDTYIRVPASIVRECVKALEEYGVQS